MARKRKMSNLERFTEVTNGAVHVIETTTPYTAHVKIKGVSPILFHAWNIESIAAKASAAKGSESKKNDDVESYVYRNEAGEICIPGEYFRGSIVNAAKYIQDPRSPRKSAMDLFKAGIVALSPLCSLGTKKWDFLDQRRVTIQRNGITRTRPAMTEGWIVDCDLLVLLPEYINADLLNDRIQTAGRLIGVGDFRPTYGRFQVIEFRVSQS